MPGLGRFFGGTDRQSESAAELAALLGGQPIARSAVRAATKRKKRYTVIADGDSIPQAQLGSYPFADADRGWRYATTIAPAQPSAWIVAANFSYNCASGEVATMDHDGSGKLRVAIAGDTAGAWVDVTKGTFFALTSGTSGKQLFVTIRSRNQPATALTYTITDTGSSQPPGRMGLSGLFHGGLLRSGLLIGNKVMVYAVGGDQPADVLNRVPQVIAANPDLYCLNVGVNWITTAGDIVLQICTLLNAAGIRVLVTPTVPRVWDAATTLVHEAQVAAIKAIDLTLIEVVDLYTPLRDFTSTTEIAVASQYNADRIHPSLVGTCQRVADVLDPVFRKLMPGNGRRRRISAQNAYNAATANQGNYLGARALMTGTGGTFAATPAPTGQLPDNWTDIYWSGTGYTTVVYTAPGSATPIPREDEPGKFWSQVVATNAVGTCSRGIQVQCETTPVSGTKIRARLVLQMLNTTNLADFQVALAFTGSTAMPQWYVLQIGTLPTAANTIEDTGVLYIESDDIEVPPGITALRARINFTNGNGGNTTLRWADLDIMPAAAA